MKRPTNGPDAKHWGSIQARRIFVVMLVCMLVLSGCAKVPAETTAPTVPAVTEVTEPPTQPPVETAPPTEATEPTVPTEPKPEPEDDEIVRILDYLPSVREELAYAGEDNFTGQPIYLFCNAYLRYGTIKKLAAVREELAQQGLGLLIWDGFRPVSAQAKLWEICPDERYVSHPVTGSRSHCRGSAVDLTLYDLETGEKLTMPTGFDDFTKYADRDYSDCSEEAAKNARLLEETMIKHGFKPYSAEWWHYTDTDSYPVDEKFEPPVG